jgi:hypothetical protein
MDVFSTRGKTPEQTEGQPSCPHLSPLSVGPQLGEDSFRRVVEWAPSAMVMIDRDGIMVLVNAQTERMFNYKPPGVDRAVSRNARAGTFSSSPCGFPRRLFWRFKAATDGRRPRPCRLPLRRQRIPGRDRPQSYRYRGRSHGAGFDHRHHRAPRAQQRLEDALREKTVLLNEVHHRVKNNLQVITSLLNLQADHAADPRLRAMLAESCGRVKAMALTHQLLYERKDFSRLDLGDYLERLMHSIRATYRGTGDRIMLRLGHRRKRPTRSGTDNSLRPAAQ